MKLRMIHWLHLDRAANPTERDLWVILYVIVLATTLALSLITVANSLGHGLLNLNTTFLLIATGINLFFLWMIWKGEIKWVRIMLPLAAFILVTIIVARNDGLFDEALLAFPTVIIIAGILQGRRGIVIYTLFSLLALTLIGLGQAFHLIGKPSTTNGLIHDFSDYFSYTRLITVNTLVAMSGGVSYLLVNLLTHSTEDLSQRTNELVERASEMQALQASLEAQVIERTRSLEVARKEAETARLEAEAQALINARLVRLNEALHGEQSLPGLAANITRQLCLELGAQVGALFVLEDERLYWTGGYACTASSHWPDGFQPGEGFAGQAALEKKITVLEDIPIDSLRITSGLGYSAPRNLMLIPLIGGSKLAALAEVGSLQTFTPEQIHLVELARNGIATTIQTVKSHMRVQDLLAQTQQQAEELQAQEEELRAANEELHLQAETLRKQTFNLVPGNSENSR
jgi:hypothetical protein